MGAEPSTLPPPTPVNYRFFSLTFRIYDTIKVVDADHVTIGLIRQIIATYWTDGIQNETIDQCGTVDFKLYGLPFHKFLRNRFVAIRIKRVCCMLFAGLQTIGWRLAISSSLSRYSDLSTLFFERDDVAVDLMPHIICLSLSADDKLQLINTSQNVQNQLVECVGRLLQNREQIDADTIELKLYGYPWDNSNLEEGLTTRRLLLNIFRQFHSNHSLKYYGTANLNGRTDCIFFEKIRNVSPINYCCLSLNSSDRIRLVDCPQPLIDVVGQCIMLHWPRRIQETRIIDANAFEYKLNGYPWNCYGEDAINSRCLITGIIESCVRIGWSVVTALDISRKPNDTSIFILRNCQPSSIPHICLAPNNSDKLWLINAANRELIGLVAGVLRTNWTYGIQREVQRAASCYEWKLVNFPWLFTGRFDMLGGVYGVSLSRILMTRMIGELARNGWRLICSADVSSKYVSQGGSEGYPLDVHSWFIAYVGHLTASDGASTSMTFVDSSLPPTDDEAAKPTINEEKGSVH